MTDVKEAKELLDLVATPSVLVTGTFLAFAGRAIKENEVKVDNLRMWFAFAASIAAVGVTAALAGLMLPLAIRSISIFSGGVQAVLVVYVMITLSVLGTAVYCLWTVKRCIDQLRRPSQ